MALLTFLLCALVGSFNVVPLVATVVTPKVFVDPEVSVADVGEFFTVNINISDVTGLHAWDLEVEYDRQILYTDEIMIKEGPFLSSTGPTDWWAEKIVNGIDYLYASCWRLDGGSVDGSGTLANVTFQVLQAGKCDLNLNVWLYDTDWSEISHTKESGTFSSLVTMYVEPGSVTVKQDQTFTVNIDVYNVEGLCAWEFRMQVDPEMLYTNKTLVKEGPFLTDVVDNTQFVVIQVPAEPAEPSQLIVGCMFLEQATASGSGTLANITFIAKGGGITVLDLFDTHLFDENVADIEHATVDGEVNIIGKSPSAISLSAYPTTITIDENTTISGAITPMRTGVTVTIWYKSDGGGNWIILKTVATDVNSQYSCTWTPAETGTYGLKASWLGDMDTLPAESSIVTIHVMPPPARTLSIKLSGELDYLFMEDVKVRLVTLVRDVGTMEPLSDANVTIEIYDPDGNLWISDIMTERLLGTGIYEWESEQTIRELRLQKGVYVVHTQASYEEGPVTSDVLEFHVDPPAEQGTSITMYYAIVVTVLLVGVLGYLIVKRRLRVNARTRRI